MADGSYCAMTGLGWRRAMSAATSDRHSGVAAQWGGGLRLRLRSALPLRTSSPSIRMRFSPTAGHSLCTFLHHTEQTRAP